MSWLVIVLKLHLFCVVLCEDAYATLWAEDIEQSVGVSSSLLGPRGQISAVRFGSKHLYPLIQLAGPLHFIEATEPQAH